MRILQRYNLAAMMSDAVARGWRIADVHRAANAWRAKQKPAQPALSYDAVARCLAGRFHNPPVVVAIAAALGKSESFYRVDLNTTRPRRATAAR
jgi:hypothetical protein